MVVRSLARDPFGELREAFIEVLLRAEAQDIGRFAAVAEAMANVADPRLAGDLRLDVAAAERARDRTRDVIDAAVYAGADVEHLRVSPRVHERIGECARDVADVNEIAPLLAILEDQRALPIRQTRRENREHASVRIRKCLARPVDVEQAQARA